MIIKDPNTLLSRTLAMALPAWLVLWVLVLPASAQQGRPAPARPVSQAANAEDPATPQDADASQDRGGEGRRLIEGPPVKLGFQDVAVSEMIEWIAAMTGKVIIPVNPAMMNNSKISILTDDFIERAEALDLVFTTFRLNRIAIIESEDTIIIGSLDDLAQGPVAELPVLAPSINIMSRQDRGTLVIKIFAVVNRNAEGIYERIDETKPSYVMVSVDIDSNQLVVLGDIGYCQQVQRIIDELDKKWVKGEERTFRLAHADATEIADNITELFEAGTSTGSRTSNQRNPRQQAARGRQPGQAAAVTAGGSPGPEVEMRITVNAQQNTVTVFAESDVLTKIQRLIDSEWDLPRPETTSKVYMLRHSDPIKMRDTLNELLGGGSGGSGGARIGGAAGGGAAGGVAPELPNLYRIEAFPDQNSLIVIAKTEQSFEFLDGLISNLDQPNEFGLPLFVELNHADAVDVAAELNALLQVAGSGATITVPGEGLSGQGLGGSDSGGADTSAVGREAQEAQDVQFPWMRGRQDDEQAKESPLIGMIRVMPVVRQNALSIVCPAQYRDSIRKLVLDFDKPGRQVMISAIIAEVDLNDDFALGLRVSSGNLSLTNIDNALTAGLTGTGNNDDFLDGLFDTGVLDLNVNANLAIQALSQLTNVRILQEPRVFTADNQEAYFFDGQDVPFIANSNTTDQGLNQSFDYRQVGVVLNVRPRITAQFDVDMEVYMELSSIVPGQTLFGGFIIDRRSTTTALTVKNGQTIVVSGILRESESKITRKVPFFGDIPLIGELFTSRENASQVSELVAFITPVVVGTPESNYDLNAPDLQRLDRMTRSLEDQANDSEGEVRERILEPPLLPSLPNLESVNPFTAPPPRDLRDDTKRDGR